MVRVFVVIQYIYFGYCKIVVIFVENVYVCVVIFLFIIGYFQYNEGKKLIMNYYIFQLNSQLLLI